MDAITVLTQVGQDGTINLELPQFTNTEVEIVIRPTSDSQHGLTQALLDILSREDMSEDDGLSLWLLSMSIFDY